MPRQLCRRFPTALPAARSLDVQITLSHEGRPDAGHLDWISRSIRVIGPYLLVELILPGGTLLALLLWISQHTRVLSILAAYEPITTAASAVLRAVKRSRTGRASAVRSHA